MSFSLVSDAPSRVFRLPPEQVIELGAEVDI